MSRFLKLTVAQYKSPGDAPDATYPVVNVMLNIEHIVSITEGMPRTGYPDGFTMITMSSVGEGGVSEVYFVAEKLDFISRNLPI
jgi:hypothetical protein